MTIAKQYMTRIRAGLRPDLTSLVRFIQEETYINLKPYSFVGYEYQRYVVELVEKDKNIDLSIEKPSQIGMSEVLFRIVAGQMSLHPGYSIGFLMPSAKFSSEVVQTRIGPMINQSPHLSAMIDRNVDSASVKRFQNGSILYALGASPNSKSTLINRPITLAISDELDKLDYKTHTGMRSRQTASRHGKPRISLSTPTAPGIGINAEASGRQLHYQIIICHSCKHEYVPDYFEQVEIPGFTEPLISLTVDKVYDQGLDVEKAFHFCPKCHTPSKLTPEHRQWIVEDAHYKKIHVRLTPYDAPALITAPDLVTSQLTYSNHGEFLNQGLALPTELKDSTIDVTQVKFTNEESPTGARIAGLDMGKESHYTEAVVTPQVLFVDKIEIIPVNSLQEDVENLVRLGKVCSIVGDSLPFLDTNRRLSFSIPHYWPAIYTTPTNPEPQLYKLKEGTHEEVRQINLQKNLLMDTVAGLLMSGMIVFKSSEYDALLLKHLQSMRRVRDYRFPDIRYKWVKQSARGKGRAEDHLFHSLCYLVAASKVIGKAKHQSTSMPLGTMISTFRANKKG